MPPPPIPHRLLPGEGTTILVWFGLVTGFFFALNIGASAAAAAMGSVYGARILRRPAALLCVAVFSLLGAYFGGQAVVETISSGLVPPDRLGLVGAVTVLACAAVTLLTANLAGVPLSTSEVTVGAVVGAGLALGVLKGAAVVRIVQTWAILPFVTLVASYVAARVLVPRIGELLRGASGRRWRRLLAAAMIGGGCYEAFAAGMNNVANAAGPLVAAGVLEPAAARLFGGVGLGLGALWFGARVLETNGKKITHLNLASGVVVSFTAGTLVIISSLQGTPVPLTQATTVAIIGSGLAVYGRQGINVHTVRRVVWVWVLSPVVAMAVSYLAVRAVRGVQDWSSPLVLLSGCSLLATALAAVLAYRGLRRAGPLRRATKTDQARAEPQPLPHGFPEVVDR